MLNKDLYFQHIHQLPNNPQSFLSAVADEAQVTRFEQETGKIIGTIDNQPYYNIHLDLYENTQNHTIFRYCNVEYTKMGSAVLVIFRSDAGREKDLYLLERHFRVFTNQMHYEIPRGFADPDDLDTKVTAVREIEEETGLRPEMAQLIPLGTMFPDTGLTNAEIGLYAAEFRFPDGHFDYRPQNQDENEEINGYTLVNEQQLQALIVRNKLCDSFSLAAILKYQAIRR